MTGLPVSVMMDIAIAAVFLLFTLLGWKRGLFRSLAELAAMALALLLGRTEEVWREGAIKFA